MHPLLHSAGCIVSCIIVCQISQLSPHALIQSMGIFFCIYRLISCQNIDYNYPIWDISARSGLLGVMLGVILSDGGFCSPALFSPHITTFRDRNQRLIKKCTLLWTITGYSSITVPVNIEYKVKPCCSWIFRAQITDFKLFVCIGLRIIKRKI